jgi:MFS family permease
MAMGASERTPVENVAASPSRVGAYAWYVLLVLALVYVVNFIDRRLLAILVEDIERDLRVDDGQIGFLYGTAFAIFYALFGIPLARLADNWRRSRLIGLGLGLWSSMTALSGFSRNFTQLTIGRIGVGVGEAAASPAAYSLIADYFPMERRGLALAIYTAGSYVGSGLSLPIGGAVTSNWNRAFHGGRAPLHLAGWQAAFLAVGLPGLFLAVWVSTLREPARVTSVMPKSAGAPEGPWRAFGRELFAVVPPFTLINAARSPGGLSRNLVLLGVIATMATGLVVLTHDTLQWTIYGVGAYAVGSWALVLKRTDAATWRLTLGTPAFLMALGALGSIAAIDFAHTLWAPAYLLRTFYTDLEGPGRFLTGVTAREEVAYFSFASSASAVVGVVLGGWLSDLWRRRDVRGRVGVIAASYLVYLPLIAVLYTTHSLKVFFVCQPVVAAAGAMWWGTSVPMMQEMVLPRMRATAVALALLASTMIGQSLGPYIAGKVGAVSGSLTTGVLSLFLAAPLSLWLLWQISRRLETTEATRAERAGDIEFEPPSPAAVVRL